MTSAKNQRKSFRERQKDSKDAPRCPWCFSKHIDAEFVDVGVGMMQCSPYGCEQCHSYQIHYSDCLPGEVLRSGWREGEWYRTVMQRHSNCMLYMRRMFKEIALIMDLQDPNYEITDDEAQRILQCACAGWNELRVERALKDLMEKINA